jgi:hypothetical protein
MLEDAQCCITECVYADAVGPNIADLLRLPIQLICLQPCGCSEAQNLA